MLGHVANYCPFRSRSTLAKNSNSILSVWNTIREHFDFQVTGAHFSDPNNSGYNGAAGPFEAKVDMGPVEPHSARVFSHSTPATSCWNSSTNLMTSKPLVSLGAGKTLIS